MDDTTLRVMIGAMLVGYGFSIWMNAIAEDRARQAARTAVVNERVRQHNERVRQTGGDPDAEAEPEPKGS
ncbi:MAG TPA: hypothetical protein VG348_15855 [Acidimicrobiia bacterium]|jgi:hypothetical protein|nr:hypothetical protein [Acidimicrobiia bacterium]